MIEYSLKNSLNWNRIGSRKVCGLALNLIAAENKDLMVLTADFAESAGLSEFKKNYPDQFVDVGIAEQNMIGVASGLALSGCNVFVFSFSPFATLRAFEGIRSYIGYMNLNVKIIGMASGVSLGYQGNTHFGLEDIAVMKTIPNMKVISPADCTETVKVMEQRASTSGPVYVRLTGIQGAPSVCQNYESFKIGKSNILKEGSDIAIISSGFTVAECIRAARALEKEKINVTVVDMHTIKPLDTHTLESVLKNHNTIFTVEEHYTVGGMGSSIAEYITDNKINHIKLLRLGLKNQFVEVQNYKNILKDNNLDGIGIYNSVLSELNNSTF